MSGLRICGLSKCCNLLHSTELQTTRMQEMARFILLRGYGDEASAFFSSLRVFIDISLQGYQITKLCGLVVFVRHKMGLFLLQSDSSVFDSR